MSANSNDEPRGFEFKIAGLKHGESDWIDEYGLVLFGQLVHGTINTGVSILIQTTQSDPYLGTVVRFTETLDDWSGLPFYNTLHAGECTRPFCIAVQGRPQQQTILVPGIATNV